jgi:Uncharacterized conserved protein (DUF2285)/Family of unknown function (DUF6499)
MPMAHALRTGTAWDRKKIDYAYARELDGPGWAWEFVRRNEDFRRDCGVNRAGFPVAIGHVSGATVYRPQRRFLAAETWGLVLFADPDKTAAESDIFWQPELLTHAVHCHCKPSNDNATEQLSLSSFQGRRAVLVSFDNEHIAVSGAQKSSHLVVTSGTLLFGSSTITFLHEGLSTAANHHRTTQILKQFVSAKAATTPPQHRADSKYLDYLIALDGHLEGRSYREIANVIYGSGTVGPYWTDDSRGYKLKVRRAVRRGIALMNGGYRELL